mmetsp:Transcript_45611/g.98801  ORF Transcript_45611/g.98801 Transcript_45611/m.98801 type:complete len:154 (-) Transcript_45611:238-699(-)
MSLSSVATSLQHKQLSFPAVSLVVNTTVTGKVDSASLKTAKTGTPHSGGGGGGGLSGGAIAGIISTSHPALCVIGTHVVRHVFHVLACLICLFAMAVDVSWLLSSLCRTRVERVAACVCGLDACACGLNACVCGLDACALDASASGSVPRNSV